MSNEVPETMSMSQEQQPYCIWYPQLASEETYRVLSQRYPQMRYQVGRACAAAGYDGLYQELGLLPDVSIAEEARESGTKGGQVIFDSIMGSPYRFSVMDDDNRTIREDKQVPYPAFLNGDTEVRWQLHGRSITPSHWTQTHPGIEEDMHINDHSERHTHIDELAPLHSTLAKHEVSLLYQPLPPDLPTVRKTLLTCMAAFEGNIDR
ncbi:hypothetical protein ACHAQA_003928 [Verticillium albo-atrum]